jgi:hypothetical protein
MFNDRFVYLVSLFDARIKCVKPVFQEVDNKQFPVYVAGEVYDVTGIAVTLDGYEVFMKEPDGVTCDSVDIDVIRGSFVILNRVRTKFTEIICG